jgi:hypothetical protein
MFLDVILRSPANSGTTKNLMVSAAAEIFRGACPELSEGLRITLGSFRMGTNYEIILWEWLLAAIIGVERFDQLTNNNFYDFNGLNDFNDFNGLNDFNGFNGLNGFNDFNDLTNLPLYH